MKQSNRECKIARDTKMLALEVNIGEQIISQASHFEYLRSIRQNDKKIEENVKHHSLAAWMAWRNISCVV